MQTPTTPTTPQKSGTHRLGTKTIQGRVIGRDRTVVPPEEVEKLAAIGCKDQEIADWFGVNDNTLRFNFSAELTKGRAIMKMSLRRVMFNNAVHQNNTVMQIWLSKNFLHMSDTPHLTDATQPLPWNESDVSVQLPLHTDPDSDTDTDSDTDPDSDTQFNNPEDQPNAIDE